MLKSVPTASAVCPCNNLNIKDKNWSFNVRFQRRCFYINKVFSNIINNYPTYQFSPHRTANNNFSSSYHFSFKIAFHSHTRSKMLSHVLIFVYLMIIVLFCVAVQLPFEDTYPWLVGFVFFVAPLLFVATWVNLFGF